MDSCANVMFISAIACSIAKCYTMDELSILSAIFNQLGDTLATIITQEEVCNKNNKDTENKEDVEC